MLTLMTVNERSSPAAIFMKTLTKIESHLKRAKRARAFKDDDRANALRTELFKLEGWAKLHRHWPIKQELKTFSNIRDQAKRLEDAFGALDVARATAEDLRAKAQPDLAALFDERAKKARQDLKQVLKDDHWFVKEGEVSRVEKMRQNLSQIDWPSADAQFDYLTKAIVRDLADVGAKYRAEWKPDLVKTVYDRKILENSLHEWRRQLRWFSMYFQTADGLFGLSDVGAMLTAEKKKLLTDYAENTFANLPVKKTVRTRIDRVAFYEMTRIIEEIGVVKDKAERYFHIRDLLVKRGESLEKASARVAPLYGDAPTETPIDTHRLMAEYEKYKPLLYIAESLP